MKKLITFLALILLTLFVISSCTKGISESRQISAVESSTTITNSSKTNESTVDASIINKTKIKELESEITRLNTLLTTTNSDKESLTKKIRDLEKEIEKKIKRKEFYIKEGLCLTLYQEPALHRLSIKYKDNSVVDIIELYLISEIEPSPDGSKVILNDFDQEATARVYLYDVDKRKTQELLIKLPDFITISRMKWLDNRYFMFIAQSNVGLFAKGGDVYVYDTQTDNYKMIISRTNSDYQISDIDVYADSFCVFTSILYEKTFSSYQSFHHIITFDEIYDLIKNNKTVDLSKKNETFK